jgi:hypothetical protein
MAGGAEEVSAGIGTGCPLALASACNFDRTSAKVMDRSVFAPLTGFLGLTGSTTVASVSYQRRVNHAIKSIPLKCALPCNQSQSEYSQEARKKFIYFWHL